MLIETKAAGTATVRVAQPGCDKQPGHWLLASLGKKVLRPGGIELTRRMLARLAPSEEDDVVEFAPGLGITAEMALRANPRSYTAVERDPAASRALARRLDGKTRRLVQGSAESTGLVAGAYSIVYGEAMLTMQTHAQKRRIVQEAHRLLSLDGRYGIHELCLSDSIDPALRREIEREMSLEIHVGVQPLTVTEWRELLESAGFDVVWDERAPMRLLEPSRVLRDEGLTGAARIAANLLRKPDARRRVLRMRALFRKYRPALEAIALIGEKR